MLKYKIMFQIFFVSKYFWVLEALIFGTLLPDHPVLGNKAKVELGKLTARCQQSKNRFGTNQIIK